ncbi:MAG: M2 family metallopeptidase [Chitinophagaceae bacterium]|nr:M2 family metallopeptidase [Chitinophagaceae bacterium]
MKQFLIGGLCLFIFACNEGNQKLQQEAQVFIDEYTSSYVKLYKASSEAQWRSNIEIKEGDSTNAIETRKTGEAIAAFTGSAEVIEKAKKFMAQKTELTPIQAKQIEVILFTAANNPATVDSLVKARIKAETEQTEKLFGFQYRIGTKKVSTNDIDGVLKDETDLAKRRQAWEASKEVGKGLKSGLLNLRELRNQTVQALGYKDYFNYQVSEYGMSTEEMMDLNKKVLSDLWPLYRELHTYMRYHLAEKYKQTEVPDYIPADWLPNRWGQDWSGEINVEGINLDSILKTKGPEWITKQAEAFYVSLGYPALPPVFWEKSSLYPYPADSNVKKNNHASAWHMDLNNDVRSLMSVEGNSEWWETANHELGHIYYYITYTTPEVPPLLRGGANRAYHEAMGTLMGLAAMQKPFLQQAGLIPAGVKTDSIQSLLKEAMNTAVFIPFSSGTMTGFEKSLYADRLSPDQWNHKWWELAKMYQGIVPPTERGEEYCDAATKTHINDDAAQYYDYALSYVILYQMHQHICKNILKQDPHACNYFGSTATGEFLRQIMKHGSSRDWRQVLKETTGEDLNAKAMVEYFDPLMKWLKVHNQGKKYSLPEHI